MHTNNHIKTQGLFSDSMLLAFSTKSELNTDPIWPHFSSLMSRNVPESQLFCLVQLSLIVYLFLYSFFTSFFVLFFCLFVIQFVCTAAISILPHLPHHSFTSTKAIYLLFSLELPVSLCPPMFQLRLSLWTHTCRLCISFLMSRLSVYFMVYA